VQPGYGWDALTAESAPVTLATLRESDSSFLRLVCDGGLRIEGPGIAPIVLDEPRPFNDFALHLAMTYGRGILTVHASTGGRTLQTVSAPVDLDGRRFRELRLGDAEFAWAGAVLGDGEATRPQIEAKLNALEFLDACRADVNGDGVVNSDDFFAFLDLFVSGDSRADLDGDGVIGADDFFAFLDLLAAGCP